MRYHKYNRKLSDGHQQILSDISRRATINEIAHTQPKSLSEYCTKKCKKHRNTHSHMRSITPFDPITENIFDTSDSDSDIGDLRDTMHIKKNTKHKKTLTAININLGHSPSDSHTMSMNTPEPDIINININHRKTMSHGPRLMSNISNNNNHTDTRRHASIIPNMEEIDDEILSNVFIDMDIDNDSENENENENDNSIKPKLMNSCSSPPMIATTVDVISCGNNDVIKQTEWKELETLNEASDEENDDDMGDDMGDDLDFHIKEDINIKQDISPSKVSMKHRRLISAPTKLKNEQRNDLHIYRTWNYFEDMSDSLKSDFNSDTVSEHDTDHSDNDNNNNNNDDDIAFGTERVFSTFTRELAITIENPKYLFEALSSICVSLRSKDKSFNIIKHQIPFDSPILKYERVISFLKLLGFLKNNKLNAYIINTIDTSYVDAALSSCQQQLIELSKKSTTYEIISNSRLRNNSVNTSLNIPSPTILHEKKSDKPESDDLDLDGCQLYELIWSATHPNNNDHKAKYVILLCYILITTPIKFIKLLEARFFNDDHGRSSTSYSSISFDNSYAPPGYISANGSPTVGSSNLLLASSMGQSPTIPSSLPSLTTSSIIFDYEKIHSSYGVQKKVVHMIRLWMQKYWIQDWNNNYKLLSYIDIFVRKANKAYKNDDNFDDCERNKGLELIATIHKTIQKQKAEIKFNKSAISLVENNNNNNGLKINNMHMNRPRSVSSNTEVNRDKIGGIIHSRKRRKSVTKHKRKFSLLSTPRLSKMSSYDGSNSNDSERDIPSDLLKISNELICNQLALYLFNKYSLISTRECLYQYSPIHKHKENICPNIQIYKDTFNNIVKWVQSTILLQQQVSKRARIIKKWIKITDLLFNIRCFQGFVAVQCALSSQAIYTLKDAWNCNNVLKRKHHTKFKEIKVIMSASHNFENLRRLQREAHAPLIAYFGIFCKDLIYIQEGVSKRNSDGMINWNKLWRISELIKEHLNNKNTPYEKIIKININMQNWLKIQLKQYGTLKTEHIDKIAKDVAQKDKKNKKKKKLDIKKVLH